MYNFEHSYFFTDPDTSKDEQIEVGLNQSFDEDEEEEDEAGNSIASELNTPLVPKKAKKDKKKDKPDNYFKEDDNLTEAQKTEKIRLIHAKKFMNLPTNSGISGHVFKTTKLYISNQASKETKFVEEIDN